MDSLTLLLALLIGLWALYAQIPYTSIRVQPKKQARKKKRESEGYFDILIFTFDILFDSLADIY